jgi:environmental stress-induced protein Ves
MIVESMRILRASERTPTPWKNGGGVTRELFVEPAGATMADFGWRVSVATVNKPGAFSLFPGVDRQMAVISGRLCLEFGESRTVGLSSDTEPLYFPGDMPVTGTPVGGAVTDLNLMTDRARYNGRLELLTGGMEYFPSGTFFMVVSASDGLELTYQTNRLTLNSLDALLFDEGFDGGIALSHHRCYGVTVSPVGDV